MKCLVTCGPTYEPLDQVRRLTNLSTGRLGTELANFLTDKGHSATLLQGHYSTYRKPCRAQEVIVFTTSGNLAARLKELASQHFDAVFHSAAVSDFEFGKIFRRTKSGGLDPVAAGKYTTREGMLLAELIPTPKIIADLPGLYPAAKVFGWKFEVDGGRDNAIALAQKQIKENGSHYCVVNGPAYGEGYGLIAPEKGIQHCGTPEELYEQLLARASAG